MTHWGLTPLLSARYWATELCCLQLEIMSTPAETPADVPPVVPPVAEEAEEPAAQPKKKAKKAAAQMAPQELVGESADQYVQIRGVELGLDQLEIGVGVEAGQVRDLDESIWREHMADLQAVPPEGPLSITVWNPSLADQSMLHLSLLTNRVLLSLFHLRPQKSGDIWATYRQGPP